MKPTNSRGRRVRDGWIYRDAKMRIAEMTFDAASPPTWLEYRVAPLDVARGDLPKFFATGRGWDDEHLFYEGTERTLTLPDSAFLTEWIANDRVIFADPRGFGSPVEVPEYDLRASLVLDHGKQPIAVLAFDGLFKNRFTCRFSVKSAATQPTVELRRHLELARNDWAGEYRFRTRLGNTLFAAELHPKLSDTGHVILWDLCYPASRLSKLRHWVRCLCSHGAIVDSET
jgi:hypothetical protein